MERRERLLQFWCTEQGHQGSPKCLQVRPPRAPEAWTAASGVRLAATPRTSNGRWPTRVASARRPMQRTAAHGPHTHARARIAHGPHTQLFPAADCASVLLSRPRARLAQMAFGKKMQETDSGEERKRIATEFKADRSPESAVRHAVTCCYTPTVSKADRVQGRPLARHTLLLSDARPARPRRRSRRRLRR